VAALEAVAPGWGSTVQHLNLQRFVEQGQLTAAAARLVEALAQQRILSLGARLPRPPQLASDQLELILRFRVEAHPALSLERKLVLLQQLASSDPSYPSVYVRGVLLAREGDCHGAIDAWRQAITMRQSAAVARANLRWCEQRLQAPAVE
jgi:predicted negative regulator of RcsB-dependent stress response